MSIERNKQVAAEFLARFTAGDLPGAMALLTDDATWWISGKPETFPVAGVYDKERLARLFATMGSRLKAGLAMTARNAIGEGDQVAMEAESVGVLTNGRIYQQQYHFLMSFHDGRIRSVKEYIDTQHAHSVWLAKPEERAA